MTFELPTIYPITDKKLARRSTHLGILKELVRGGARLVQIRDKSTPGRELLLDLRHCIEFAERNQITLLVNDRCDLVLSCGADGVHLGQEDMPPYAARAILEERHIIGLSTHTLEQVQESRTMPIQYIGFGPVFGTTSKANAWPATGLRKLANACRTSAVPVVAIGGIGRKQIREILDAGAASAAVISALMTAKDLARQMERFLSEAREK